jgi:hypothetical protein
MWCNCLQNDFKCCPVNPEVQILPRQDRIAVYMLLYIHKHIKDHGPFICVAIFSILYPCKNEEQDEEQQQKRCSFAILLTRIQPTPWAGLVE